jgi:hypothetical protein
VDPNTWIPGVDYPKVHALLELDRGDGVAFPAAWAKMYGNGRVFYSSLGHRDDVFMAGPSMDYDGLRDNGDAVNAAERKHIVNGIKWALGLVDGDVTPGNLKSGPGATGSSFRCGRRRARRPVKTAPVRARSFFVFPMTPRAPSDSATEFLR